MTKDALTLAAPADGEVALEVTLDWLRAADSTDAFGELVLRPLDASGTPDTLAAHLDVAGLSEWRDSIIGASNPGQPLHLEPRLRWLMGRAAIELAVETQEHRLLRVVEELQMIGGLSNAELVSEISGRFSDGDENYSLLDYLRSRLEQLWDAPFNARLRKYAEETSNLPLSTRSFWSLHDLGPFRDHWIHVVSASLWPDRYMEMLSSFPIQFQLGFGEPLTPIDLDLVASLVRASPPVFSSDGIPLGPAVVFALFNKVEAQFATINAQETTSAKHGIGKILDSVFSREDGDWIGRTWIQHIIRRDAPRRAGRSEEDIGVQRTLQDFLLVQLSHRVMPLVGTVWDWVRQEEALWGVHRVLSEASILEAHDDKAGAAEILAEAVKQGLVSAVGRPAGLASGSPESNIVARVLTNLPNMKQWFEALWCDTYQLREHLSYWAHSDLDNPAYPALAWGLIGLNSSQAANVDQAEFWRVISAAVFETQRIDPHTFMPNGAMRQITLVTVQLGAALVERGILPIRNFVNFMADQLEPSLEHARLWQIARSEVSDTVALDAGRMVGVSRLTQALETGLKQEFPTSDAILDPSAREDLADFLSRL